LENTEANKVNSSHFYQIHIYHNENLLRGFEKYEKFTLTNNGKAAVTYQKIDREQENKIGYHIDFTYHSNVK
jgi:hypothetical protein